MRYNQYRAAQINATAKPGYSSAQAMKALEEVFAETARALQHLPAPVGVTAEEREPPLARGAPDDEGLAHVTSSENPLRPFSLFILSTGRTKNQMIIAPE